MKIKLKSTERVDDLQIKGYKIIQDTNKFCFGIDAVLLTGFIKARKKDNVLDLGTGTGIIPILLEAKYNIKSATALEIQDESVDMAMRSICLNELDNKIKIVKGDIKEADNKFPLSSFDLVTSNPPYMINKNGLQNNNIEKTIARHEVLCNLDDVIRVSSKLVKVGGKFAMVHRPHRLSDIMYLLRKYKLEPKRMRLVYPKENKEPNMVLIEAVRHGKSMLKVEAPLIVYNNDGSYTDEIIKIYGLDN